MIQFAKKYAVLRSLFMILGLFIGCSINAQTISYPRPCEAVTRGLDSTFLIVRIDFPTSINNFVTINLGSTNSPGLVQYVAGSVSKDAGTAAITIAQSNITNLQSPVFSVSNTTNGDYIIFSIKRRANAGTATLTKDAVNVTGTLNFSETDPDVNPYTLKSPTLTVVPAATIANANIGNTFIRTITVTNGGSGCLDTLGFWIKYPAGSVQLNSLKIGATTLTPFFQTGDSAYFRVTGTLAFGADKLFCNGETISFTENITLLKCNPTTVYGAAWYAHQDNAIGNEVTAQSIITMTNDIPILTSSLTTILPYQYCFASGESKIQNIRITNSGTGPATNVQLSLRYFVPGSFSGQVYYDTTNAWVVRNSAGIPIGFVDNFSNYSGINSYSNSCGSSVNLIGEGTGNLINNIVIAAGDYVTVDVVTIPYYFNCDPNWCAVGTGWIGLQTKLDYKNQCAAANYTEPYKTLAGRPYTLYQFTIEHPTNIDGFGSNNTFNLDLFFNYLYNTNNPDGSGNTKFAIPLLNTGLSPTVSSIVLNGTTFPINVINDTLFIVFPQNIVYGSGLIRIPMIANCSFGGGPKTLDMFVLNKYSGCTPATKLACNSTSITINCPTTCLVGGATPVSFSLKRINYGQADNDNNGIPDVSGSINPALINDHHCVHGDTLLGKWNIKIYPNIDPTDPNFGAAIKYVYIDAKLANPGYYKKYPGHLIEIPNAQVIIYPAGGGAVINCTVSPTVISDQFAHYELTTICRGGNWLPGDSIVVNAKFFVNSYNTDNTFAALPSEKKISYAYQDLFITSNTVYSTYTQKITNQTAPIAGQTYTCNTAFNDYAQISRIWLSPWMYGAQAINGCSNTIYTFMRQYTRAQEGPNIFPYEYRNFYIPDEQLIIIPSGYTYRPNTAYFYPGSFPISNANIYQVADTLHFINLKNFYTKYGGTILAGDETESNYLIFQIDPSCTAIVGSSFGGCNTIGLGNGVNTPATNYYQWLSPTNQSIPQGRSENGMYIYTAPQNALTGGGTVTTTDANASWDVVLQNTSNNIAADNGYIFISPVNAVSNIVVKEGGTTIVPDVNGFYRLNTLTAGSNRTLTITGKAGNCGLDSIKVNQGWGCTGYPASFAAAACTNSTWLKVENYESQIQVAITKQPTGTVLVCNGETLEFVMGSAQAAFTDNPEFRVTPPTGMNFSLGQIEYPLGSGNWQTITPSVAGGVYTYNIEDHTQLTTLWGTRGLPGTINYPGADQRQAKLRITYGVDCSFQNGTKVTVQQRASRPCGSPISITQGYNGTVRTNPIFVLPTLSCIVGDTNFTVAPMIGTVNWNALPWSLGHVPTPCESAQIKFTGTSATAQTVTINVTADVSIKNLILLNNSTSAASQVFKTVVQPGINMFMNGNVSMSANAALASDSCIFNTNAGGLITVNGYTTIGYVGDNAYSIFGSSPSSTGYYNYLLKGDLTFNERGLNRSKYTSIVMDDPDTLYINNNTNAVFPNAVMFDRLTIGGVSSLPTVIFAGSNQNAYMNDNGGYVEIINGSTLILNENYTLNAKDVQTTGVFNSSFHIKANSNLILRGNSGGEAGSNYPAKFINVSVGGNTLVKYDGRNNSVGAFSQTVFAAAYDKLHLSNSSGTGRATKKTNSFIYATTSVTIDPFVDLTLGLPGTATPVTNLNCSGPINVLNDAGLYCNRHFVYGTGSFTMGNNCFLGIGNFQGIAPLGTSTGNIRMTGGRTFSTTSNYIYDGVVAQTTGLGLPSVAINALTINNPTTVTASQNILANAAIILQQGVLDISTTKITSNGNGFITSTGGIMKANRGTVELKGTSGVAQTLSGSWFVGRNISTLINANSVGFTNSATVGDSLLISSALLYGTGITNSLITTNNNLTLLSRDTATARFGEIVLGSGNNITGNVVVERFIPATRKWRYLSWPTNSTQTAQQSLMENAATPNANPNPGYGCIVTDEQATWAAGNFDSRSISGPSVKYYDPILGAHVGIPNTRSYLMNSKSAYFNFVRGNRLSLPIPYTNSTTILRSVGTLKTGAQTFPVTSFKFAGIGNPYASPVDLRKISFASIPSTATVYVWDPKLVGQYGIGAYQQLNKSGGEYRITPGGGSYGANNSIVDTLESGAGFFIKAGSSNGNVVFNEIAKTISARTFTRMQADDEEEKIFALLSLVDPTENILVDGATTFFANDYESKADEDDAEKIANINENVGFKRDGQRLGLERRKTVTEADTLFLNISGMRVHKYQWDISANKMDVAGRSAYLIDKYLNTSTEIDLSQTSNIQFDIINTPASYAVDRFMIVFKVAPTNFTNISATRNADKTVKVGWGIAQEINVANYEIQHSSDGTNFITIGTKPAIANNATNPIYAYEDATATKNNNWYRVKLNSMLGTTQYTSIAMVGALPESGEVVAIASIYINPNPVVDGNINLQVNNMAAGNYALRLTNTLGQVMHKENLKINSNNVLHTINIPALREGVYQLEVVSENGERMMVKFIAQ
jgi:Secretion system C-terminal sorting domain